MCTTSLFTKKFADSIVSVLHCHDRVIFKGYLPFFKDNDLNRLSDYELGIRRKDFVPFLEKLSNDLVENAKRIAAESSAPYEFLDGRRKKEEITHEEIQKRNLLEGLVAVLCRMETCLGLNLMNLVEQKLFLAVPCGANRLNGFRNRDIQNALYIPTKDLAERRRQTQRISRQLQLLRAHGLIRKVPYAHRYHVTEKGEAVMTAAIRICAKEFQALRHSSGNLLN